MRVVIHNHVPVRDAQKLSHEAVEYGRSNGKDRCELCQHFLAGDHCELVQDPISRDGWCKKFKRG